MIIIDRFEGTFAVCECDGKMIDIEKNILPEDACEGDVIFLSDGGYVIDREQTDKRKKRAQALLQKFKER